MIRYDLKDIYKQYEICQSYAQKIGFLQHYYQELKRRINQYKKLLADNQSQHQNIKAELPLYEDSSSVYQEQFSPQQNSYQIDNASIKKKSKVKQKNKKKKQLTLRKETIESIKQEPQRQSYNYLKRKKSQDEQEIKKISIEHVIQQDQKNQPYILLDSSSEYNDGIQVIDEIIIFEEPPQIVKKQPTKKVNLEEQKQNSIKTTQVETKIAPIVKMLPSSAQENIKTNQYGESIYKTQIMNNKQTENNLKQQPKQVKKKIIEKQVQCIVIDDEKKQKPLKQVTKKPDKIVIKNVNDELEQINYFIDEPNIPKRANTQNNPSQLDKINQQNRSTILYEYKPQQSFQNEQSVLKDQPKQKEIHPLFKLAENKQTNEQKQEHNFQEKCQLNQVQQVSVVQNHIKGQDHNSYKQDNVPRESPLKLENNGYQRNQFDTMNQQQINQFSQSTDRISQNFQKIDDQYKQRQQAQQTPQVQLNQQIQQVQQIQQIQQVQQIHSLFQKPQNINYQQSNIYKDQQFESKTVLTSSQTQIDNIQNKLGNSNQQEIVIESQNQVSPIGTKFQQEDSQQKINCIDVVGQENTNQTKQQIQSASKERFIINNNSLSNIDANIIQNSNRFILEQETNQDVPKQQNNPHSLFMKINQTNEEQIKSNQQTQTTNPLLQNVSNNTASKNTQICNIDKFASNDIQFIELDHKQQTAKITQDIEEIEDIVVIEENICTDQILEEQVEDDQNSENSIKEVERHQLPIITKNVEKPLEEYKPLITTQQQLQPVGVIKIIAFPQQDLLEDIEIPIFEEKVNKQQKLSLFNIEQKLEQSTNKIYFLLKSRNNKSKFTFARDAIKSVIIQKIYKTISFAYIKLKLKFKKKSFMNLESQIQEIENNQMKIEKLLKELHHLKSIKMKYKELLLNEDVIIEPNKKTKKTTKQQKNKIQKKFEKSLQNQKQEKIYYCKLCLNQFDTKEKLLKHQSKHEKTDGINQYLYNQ